MESGTAAAGTATTDGLVAGPAGRTVSLASWRSFAAQPSTAPPRVTSIATRIRRSRSTRVGVCKVIVVGMYRPAHALTAGARNRSWDDPESNASQVRVGPVANPNAAGRPVREDGHTP